MNSQAALQLLIQLKDEASAGLQRIGGAVQGFAPIVAGAALAAGAAMVGFGVDSMKVAGDFEAGMNRLKSVAGGAMTEAGLSVDQFRDKALALGMETQFSAAQAQEAMINLAKGGVPVKSILTDATAAVLDLAAAGELELGPAAEIVAKQLGVWGETGTTAADVANLMAQAANASTVDVDELALGMANAGGMAKTMGLEFKDFTQTMALIAPNFSSASDAGTSLKTMLQRLQPTTADARAAFAEYGLSAFDTQKALAFLKMQGVEPADKSLRGINVALDQYAKSMKMSEKETSDLFLRFEDNQFFDKEGKFVGMAKASELMQTAFKDLSEEEKSMALNTIFGSDALRAAAAIAQAGAPGFKAMGDSMAAAGTAAEQAKIKQDGWNFAMDQLKGSIETLQIVIGSALLPIGTALLNNFLIPVVNAVLSFSKALTDGQDPAAGLIEALKPFIPNIEEILATVGPFAKDVVDFFTLIYNEVSEIVKTLVSILVTLFGELKTEVEANSNTILSILTVAWESIKTVISVALALIVGILKTTLALMKGDTSAAWAAIKEMTEKVWNALKSFLSTLLTAIFGDVKTKFEGIKETISTNVEAARASVAEKFDAVKAKITAIVDSVKTAVGEGFDNVRSKMVGAVQGAIDGIGGLLGQFRTAGENMINGIVAGITALAGNIYDAVIGAVSNAISAAIQKIKDFISNPLGGVFGGSSVRTTESVAQYATPRRAGSVAGGTGNTYIFQIDARGSSLSEAQIEAAISRAIGSAGRRADIRLRTA